MPVLATAVLRVQGLNGFSQLHRHMRKASDCCTDMMKASDNHTESRKASDSYTDMGKASDRVQGGDSRTPGYAWSRSALRPSLPPAQPPLSPYKAASCTPYAVYSNDNPALLFDPGSPDKPQTQNPLGPSRSQVDVAQPVLHRLHEGQKRTSKTLTPQPQISLQVSNEINSPQPVFAEDSGGMIAYLRLVEAKVLGTSNGSFGWGRQILPRLAPRLNL